MYTRGPAHSRCGATACGIRFACSGESTAFSSFSRCNASISGDGLWITSTSWRPARASESTRCRMRFLPERQRFTLTPWRRSNSVTRRRRSFSAIDEYRLTTGWAKAVPLASANTSRKGVRAIFLKHIGSWKIVLTPLSLSLLRNRVDERGLAGLYAPDGALQRSRDRARLVDRAFGVPAHRLRQR